MAAGRRARSRVGTAIHCAAVDHAVVAASRMRSTRPLKAIALPAPVKTGGRSVGRALQLRRTCRNISARPVSLQALSNLLWAAYGINRVQGPFAQPGRTAASASNSQEIDLYVLLGRAAYAYNPFAHALLPAARGDLRALAMGPGQAHRDSGAPVRLIYVADLDRLTNTRGYAEPGLRDPEIQRSYYYVDTGMIAANVYLHASANGFAAWFHNCDRARLAARLRLSGEQRVLFAQSVGYARGARSAVGSS